MLGRNIEHTLLAYEYANLYPPPPLIPIEENGCSGNNLSSAIDRSLNSSIRGDYTRSNKDNKANILSFNTYYFPKAENLDTHPSTIPGINRRKRCYSVTPDQEWKEQGIKIENDHQEQKRSKIVKNKSV